MTMEMLGMPIMIIVKLLLKLRRSETFQVIAEQRNLRDLCSELGTQAVHDEALFALRSTRNFDQNDRR